MKGTKAQKGITLIALIITIIVLLILAVVTIGAVRDGGIITHAQNAARDYTIAQEKEQINLALSEWQIQKNTPSNTKTFKEVVENALLNTATVSGEDEGPLTITMNDTGNQYTVTDDGEVTPVEKEISISPTELSLTVQGTQKLTVALKGGLKVENIKYSSSDKGVVTVSESGEVTGIAVGEATITVTCDGYSATCKVTVREVSLLEQYVLGQDLAGRPMTDIIDMETFSFIDDTETEGIDETQTIGAKFITSAQESDELGIIYFESQGVTYKFGVNVNSYVAEANYGVVKVYEPEEGTRVGKTVKYDNKIWTILYDDSTNGLQMISNQSLLYNDAEFKFGYNDILITDWTGAEFDGIDRLSDFEKSVYSYNNAIDTLNTACKNIVAANDNITDVRCVGSNPTNKSAENETLYTSENLAIWPTNNSTYAAGIGNGIGKSTDLNYESDFDRMVALGINIGYDSAGDASDYWLASRFVSENSDRVRFIMRYVDSEGSFGDHYLWCVHESYAEYYNYYHALRPVVSLASNIQLVADSTGEADYTF